MEGLTGYILCALISGLFSFMFGFVCGFFDDREG